MKSSFKILVLLFFSSLSLAREYNWKNICESTKSVVFPKTDEPDKTELSDLKKCDSQSSYYGIGKAIDYKAALKCAFAERAQENGIVFGGDSILMMLYANGLGVSKNYDIALMLACGLEAAPAEMEGRISHLNRLKNKNDDSKSFDLCDDITSGFMQGLCVKKDYRIEQSKRNAEFELLISKWSESEKTALKKLQEASNEFTKARAKNEIDLSGTGRSAFQIAEESIQQKDFKESLEKFDKGKAPKFTLKQLKEEDKKLNLLYKRLQENSNRDQSLEWGTVTKEGIKNTQKSWLNYRDSWVNFAKIKYPKYSSDSVAAWFTKKRNHMLTSFTR